MRTGTMVFTQMNRVIFGRPAAEAIVAEADRLGAKRVFVLTGRTLNTKTDEIDKLKMALGVRFAGVHDHMPSHSPRDAVVHCRHQNCSTIPTMHCWSDGRCEAYRLRHFETCCVWILIPCGRCWTHWQACQVHPHRAPHTVVG